MTTREKIMRALIFFILAIPALPPLFAPVFQPYTFGKTILFEIAVELMFLFWLFTEKKSHGNRVSTLSNLPKSDFGRLDSPVKKSVFFMLCAFILSTALGDYAYESMRGSSARMDGLFTLLHFAAFFFMLTTAVKEDRAWEKLMHWSVGASVFAALYGLAQWFGAPFVAPSRGEIFSTLGNPAYFATYLLFHVFISLYCARRAQSKELKTVFFLVAALAIIVILLAQVTAVFLALIVGLLPEVRLREIPKSDFGKLRRKINIVFLALVMIALFLTSSSFQKLSPFDNGNALAMQNRLRVWRIAASAAIEKPFFGHGANQFERAFLRYKSIGYPVPATGETFDKPHNAFLEIAFSYGIFGLCAYLSLLWAAFSRIGKIADADERRIFRGALAAYCISLFFLFDTFSSLTLFFFLLAFFTRHSRAEAELPPFAPTAHTFGGQTSDRRRFDLRMCAGGALFLAFFFVFHFRPLYSAYFARQFFIHTDRAGALHETLKNKALQYRSFNRHFIERAILIVHNARYILDSIRP